MGRFLVLGIFCAGNLLNEMMQLTFSPVFAATEEAFDASAAAVTWLPTIYLALFAPAALALAMLRTSAGLRVCLVGGAVLQAIGAWLRFLACMTTSTWPRGAFPLLLSGQALAALAQPVYTNLPAALTATWFSSGDRSLATVIATLANPVGNALGSVVPALLVPDGAKPADAAAALSHITLAQAAAATAVALATLAFVADAPAVPPSASAALRRVAIATAAARRKTGDNDDDVGSNDEHSSSLAVLLPPPSGARDLASEGGKGNTLIFGSPFYCAALAASWVTAACAGVATEFGALACNANFAWLLAGFAVGLGVFNALLALLGQMLAPFGYSSVTAGIVGGAMLGAGLISALFAGAALRATGAFVPALRLGIAAAAAAMLVFLLMLRPGGEAGLLAAAALLGACAVPLLPLALENAAEATFPASEDTSAALLTACGKLVGVLGVLVLQPLVSASNCSTVITPAFFTIIAAIAAASACLFCFRRDYRRIAAERSAGAIEPQI